MYLAFRRDVVVRAVKVALVVGTLLIAINHGDAVVAGDVDAERALRMLLTMFVPYAVSTYSSVGAIRAQDGGAA